jgi:hypothetical protein
MRYPHKSVETHVYRLDSNTARQTMCHKRDQMDWHVEKYKKCDFTESRLNPRHCQAATQALNSYYQGILSQNVL